MTALAAMPFAPAAITPAHGSSNNDAMARAADLAEQLCDTLAEVRFGKWRALVDPHGPHAVMFQQCVEPLPDRYVGASRSLARAIATHERIYQEFGEACPLNDRMDERYDPVNGARIWSNLDKKERRAWRRFLTCPALTQADQKAKATYIRWSLEDAGRSLDFEDLDALLSAMGA